MSIHYDKPNLMKSYVISLFILLCCLGCDNTEDLTNQVRDSISKELSEKNLEMYGLETNIISLDLVGKGNNEFVGILRTNEIRKKGSKYYNSGDSTDNNFEFEYDVYVISDGKKYSYEIKDKRVVKN